MGALKILNCAQTAEIAKVSKNHLRTAGGCRHETN